jgi:hypothetical protein
VTLVFRHTEHFVPSLVTPVSEKTKDSLREERTVPRNPAHLTGLRISALSICCRSIEPFVVFAQKATRGESKAESVLEGHKVKSFGQTGERKI